MLLFFLAAALSVSAGAPAAAVSPLLSLLRKNYGPESSLSTKFTLTIYWSVREKEEKKKGRILLASGDRFRVTIDKETFVSDGETFRHYTAGANQVVVRNLADVDRSALPSQIFFRYITAFPFREAGRGKGRARFAWKSDSGETRYREIAVDVLKKDGRITGCVLTDKNDNVFTYTFSSTVFGKKHAKEGFVFNVPKNARIVDMRQ
ncbi:MAG: outer membrane lipoprotein carrier protein LolA [Chitinispirillaceae bacterium]|nr:outer membrane lipoprotein carrier protein LolA [Chitinispirillaceae bacterium]